MRRQKGLTVEVTAGMLTISIGVTALMTAAKGGDAWDETLEIESVDGFASDIADELNREAEDGTTLVHLAIDRAILNAIEAGSLNIKYRDGDA